VGGGGGGARGGDGGGGAPPGDVLRGLLGPGPRGVAVGAAPTLRGPPATQGPDARGTVCMWVCGCVWWGGVIATGRDNRAMGQCRAPSPCLQAGGATRRRRWGTACWSPAASGPPTPHPPPCGIAESHPKGRLPLIHPHPPSLHDHVTPHTVPRIVFRRRPPLSVPFVNLTGSRCQPALEVNKGCICRHRPIGSSEEDAPRPRGPLPSAPAKGGRGVRPGAGSSAACTSSCCRPARGASWWAAAGASPPPAPAPPSASSTPADPRRGGGGEVSPPMWFQTVGRACMFV